MATPSSILAWEIPWTEEPDRLQVHGISKSWTRLSDSAQHIWNLWFFHSFYLIAHCLFFLFSSVFLPQVLLLTVLTNWNKNNYFVCLFCGWMVFVLVDTLMNNTENIRGNNAGKTPWSPRNLFFLYCVFSSRFSLSFCVCYVIS